MKKRPIRRVSKRRAKENRVYSKLKMAYLAEHIFCECCGEHAATQIHHKFKRNGIHLNDTTYWLGCCIDCHRWIHDNPEAARKEGWLLDKLGNL